MVWDAQRVAVVRHGTHANKGLCLYVKHPAVCCQQFWVANICCSWPHQQHAYVRLAVVPLRSCNAGNGSIFTWSESFRLFLVNKRCCCSSCFGSSSDLTGTAFDQMAFKST